MYKGSIHRNFIWIIRMSDLPKVSEVRMQSLVMYFGILFDHQDLNFENQQQSYCPLLERVQLNLS